MEGSEEEEEEVKYRNVSFDSLHHLFPVKWTSPVQLWIRTCGARNCFVLYFLS